MIAVPYDAKAGEAGLILADPLKCVIALNRLGQPMIDGMRADLWLKHRKTEVFNPVSRRKEV